MYVTLKDGRKIRIRMPTDEEDAAIHAAALSDPDCPPMTDEQLARLRPAREVFSPELMARLTDKSKPAVFHHVTDAEHAARVAEIRKRGRPPLDAPKVSTTIRLDADVMAAFKAVGRGWQTRINAVLREAVAAGRV